MQFRLGAPCWFTKCDRNWLLLSIRAQTARAGTLHKSLALFQAMGACNLHEQLVLLSMAVSILRSQAFDGHPDRS